MTATALAEQDGNACMGNLRYLGKWANDFRTSEGWTNRLAWSGYMNSFLPIPWFSSSRIGISDGARCCWQDFFFSRETRRRIAISRESTALYIYQRDEMNGLLNKRNKILRTYIFLTIHHLPSISHHPSFRALGCESHRCSISPSVKGLSHI